MKRVELKIQPGFNPSPDSTELDGVMFQDGQHIRFYNGRPQTNGGTQQITTSGMLSLAGCNRFIINYRKDDNNIYTVIGGDTKLWALLGGQLTNITPLQTSSYSLSNLLATNYATLGANPLQTNSGTGLVTATWASHKLIAGDWITLTGATNSNGITASYINTEHYVQSTGASTFTFTVSVNASSSGATGGAAITASTDLISATHLTHGYATGDRVNISGATNTSGITAAYINTDHLIRVNDANTYTFTCARHYATGSTSAAGGTGAVEFSEILDGQCDANYGYGYGMGLYGVGLYGVGKTAYYPTIPRIWSGDTFGTKLILCPGTTQSAVGAQLYEWAGNTATAPSVISAGPTDATYVFVDNNIVVALCNNTVKWSDQGDQTNWTASATTSAGTRQLYGAGRLLSRAEANGVNLLFTSSEIYKWRYIGKPYVFESEKIFDADGISGVHAAASFNGMIYIFGRKDFYRFNGAVIEAILPTSLREYVYQDIDTSQFAKCHVEVNARYGEVRFYYQSIDSATDVNKVVILSLHDSCWFYDAWNRTATEQNHILTYQRAVNHDNQILNTEIGYNDDNGSTLAWNIETNYAQIGDGDQTFYIHGLMIDAIIDGTAAVTVYTKLSPESSIERSFGPYIISASDANAISKVDFRAHGRMRKHVFNGTGFFRMGKCYEMIEKGDFR